MENDPAMDSIPHPMDSRKPSMSRRRSLACIPVMGPTALLIGLFLASRTASAADLEFAHGLYRQQRYSLAVEEYEKFLKARGSGPTAIEAQFYLAESLLQLGKDSRSLRLYESVVATKAGADPGLRLTAMLRVGQLRFGQGKYREASVALERFLRDGPNAEQVADATLMLGESQRELGALAKSAASLDRATKANPTPEIARRIKLARAKLLARQGRAASAETIFRELARGSQPPADEALLALGLLDFERRRHQPAFDAFDELSRRFPKSPLAPTARLNRGFALAELGRVEEAITSLESFVDENPDHALVDRALFEIGRSALALGEPRKAQEIYRRLSKSAKSSPWRDRAAVTVAEARIADPRFAESTRDLDDLIKGVRDPTSLRRLRYLSAVLQYRRGAFEKALAMLGGTGGPTAGGAAVPETEYLRGACLVEVGRFRDAIAPLRSFLTRDGSAEMRAAAIRKLGKALAHIDGVVDKAALSNLIDVAAAQPDANRLIALLADQQLAQGRSENAGRIFERLLERNPPGRERANALVGLAWSLWETDRPEEAFGRFSAAAALSHDDRELAAEAWYMTGIAAQRLGRSSEALDALLRVFRDYPASDRQVDAGFRAAELSVEANQARQADSIYRTLAERLDAGTEQARLLHGRAWLAVDGGRTDDGESFFRRLIEEFADSEYADEALLKLAEIEYGRGRYDEAKGTLDRLRARKVDPVLAPALLYWDGLVAHRRKDFEAARRALTVLNQRYAKDPLAVAGSFRLGELEFERDRPDAAVEHYRRVLAQGDADKYRATARLRIVQCHAKGKRWKEAFADAERFLAENQDPTLRGEAYYVQGRALQQQARFDEARQRFGRLIGNGRGELAAKAQFMIGETYFHQRKYAEALKEFLKVEILYEFPQWQSLAILEVGKCHLKRDEKADARSAFEKVARRFPKSAAAKEARRLLASSSR